jgi:hypothetical protein
MIDVPSDWPSDWLGEQQAKLRHAIIDLTEYNRVVPPEKREDVERNIAELKETIHRELDLLGWLP